MGRNPAVNLDEALNLTGFGKYNISALCVCMIMAIALGMDLFGSAYIVPASSCDLELTVEQRGILASVPFIGAIVTAHLWGFLSDLKGRKFVLFISMSCSFVISFVSSFSPNWIVMAVLKVFSICFSSAANALVYTLIAESSPEGLRARMMLLISCAFMSVQTIIGFLAYFILKLEFRTPMTALGIVYRPWRLLVQCLSCFNAAGAIGILFIYESPKFLASHERNEDTLRVLRGIYAKNTGDLSENYTVKAIQFDELHTKRDVSFLRSAWLHTIPIFKPPLLKNTLKLYYISIVIYLTMSSFIIWLTYILNGYFAAVENNIKDQNLCGLIQSSYMKKEIPANNETLAPVECDDRIHDFSILTSTVLCIMLVGVNLVITFVPWKKRLTMGIFLLGGVCGLLTNLIYESTVALITFILFLWVSPVMGVVSAYFAELFPTNVRGMASCLGVMVFRFSSCVGTYAMGLVIVKHCAITYYCASVLMLICVWVVSTLPRLRPKQRPN